jgi:2-keto-4-pentenoate hydratase/2-oxohepta-3-ene-1,7-dioic acid hydratase in catechol pathway
VRIVNQSGRLGLVTGDEIIDVAEASQGRFAPDIQAIYPRWDEFREWAQPHSADIADADASVPAGPRIGPPVPRPPQIFAIGLNYREHAAESGLELPKTPMVFTKFPASVTGPYDDIVLPPGEVDWEVELVAVIGRTARHVPRSEAWSYVAGLTVGQDVSERAMQVAPPTPQQFNLAKSFAGFAPIGPQLVTADEFENPDDVGIECFLGGEQMQKTRTGDLIFTIPQLVSYLSGVLPLLPGDLIFTGTPSGVGWARSPQRFVQPGEVLTTSAERIGEMKNRFVETPLSSGSRDDAGDAS